MDTVETLLWLCSIASPTGHETKIADDLANYLGTLPNAPTIRRYRNSLVVDLVTGHPGPKIALVGHTDVVPTIHDEPPRVEGDRLYGPGASDMKSGLSLMLSVAERPVARCPNLSLIFYASEEGPYVENELAVVFDEEPSLKELDFALVLEPTDNLLELGCGGTIHAKFTFKGHSAHSARPWQGDNAIYKAIGVLERLRTLCPTSRVVDGLEWVKTMSATMASGGRAPNVICDHFELNINARFAPDQTTTDIEREFLELARDTAQVEIVDVSPPALPRRDHPFIRLLEETGKLTVAPKLGWTDVSRLSALGIPAANFGPGSMSQAHQRNEYTSIEALHRGEAILRKWLSALPATS